MLLLEDDGTVAALLEPGDEGYDLPVAERYTGWLVPGFINAHGHLELSYLKGKIRPQTGLDGFVEALMQLRKADEEDILQAMQAAEAEMWCNGIVAAGDISNGNHSFEVKKRSKLRYHTFIERFAFDPQRADAAFESGGKLYAELSHLPHNNTGNITPHAPYSVSEVLLKQIARHIAQHKGILSIHNQETAGEEELFVQGSGRMKERLRQMGLPVENWIPPGVSSLQYVLEQLPPGLSLLLVHNTFTGEADIHAAASYPGPVSFCLCPGANLYIENRLPDVRLFREKKLNIVIGTDSLASNTELNIFSELKHIAKAFPEIPAEELFSWATLNGAVLFGWEKELGSFGPGKRPGVVWVEHVNTPAKKIVSHSRAHVL